MSTASLRRHLAAALICAVTVFAVAACGSSKSVSSQVKNKLATTFENSGLSKGNAQKLVNCLVPTLQSHHVYTMADANAFGNTPPSWVSSAGKSCASKLHIQ